MQRLLIGCILLTAAAAAAADTVFLVNGDRISGTLTGMDEAALTVATDYAGPLTLNRDAIQAVSTSGPVAVRLRDGNVLEVRLATEAETQGVQEGETFHALPLPKIAAIAPTPEALDTSLEGVVEPAPEPAPDRWKGSIEAGLTLRSGNTDTTDMSLATVVTRKSARHTLTLNLGAAYGEADDVLNTRRYRTEAKWQVYPRERLYLYALGGVERDDGRKLELRTNTALGIGYEIIKRDRRTLSADIGLDYAQEQWAPFTPDGHDKKKNEVRGAAWTALPLFLSSLRAPLTLGDLQRAHDLTANILDPLRGYESREEDFLSARLSAAYVQKLFQHSELTDTLTVFPNLDDTGEVRLVNELALTTPLSSTLKLKIALTSEYDSTAGESGVDAWNNTLVSGLRYEF